MCTVPLSQTNVMYLLSGDRKNRREQTREKRETCGYQFTVVAKECDVFAVW
jgi:hypothetical protein